MTLMLSTSAFLPRDIKLPMSGLGSFEWCPQLFRGRIVTTGEPLRIVLLITCKELQLSVALLPHCLELPTLANFGDLR